MHFFTNKLLVMQYTA